MKLESLRTGGLTDDIHVGEFHGHVRAVNESRGTLETVVSNRDIDRYNSIILPRGIEKHIHHYRANPVFLFNHDPSLLLGRCLRVWNTEDEVWAEFEFDLKSRFANNIFRLYSEKFLRAFSPRTRAHDIYYVWDDAKRVNQLKEIDVKSWEHLEAQRCSYVIAEHEYLEISGCTIPGNSAALIARAAETGVIDREFAREMAGEVVPSHHQVNFQREEADTMDEQQIKALAELVSDQVSERIAQRFPTFELVTEERTFSENEKAMITEIARNAALTAVAEVFS